MREVDLKLRPSLTRSLWIVLALVIALTLAIAIVIPNLLVAFIVLLVTLGSGFIVYAIFSRWPLG